MSYARYLHNCCLFVWVPARFVRVKVKNVPIIVMTLQLHIRIGPNGCLVYSAPLSLVESVAQPVTFERWFHHQEATYCQNNPIYLFLYFFFSLFNKFSSFNCNRAKLISWLINNSGVYVFFFVF